MSIGISTEHRELAGEVGRWAAALDGAAAARAAEHDPEAVFPEAWKAVTEMGLAVIAAPERLGGGGGTLLDVSVALEACATHLLPGPLLPTAVAAHVLSGEPEAEPVVATLPHGAVVALGLDGLVWGAPGAGHVLLAGADGCALVPAAGLSVQAGVGIDLSTRVGRLGPVEARTLPGAVPLRVDADAVRRTAVTLAAAEAAGVARWCLATAVAHAKTREQFGSPIGAFQAIKHLCAEMLERAEAATAAAWDAARASEIDPEQWAFAADVVAVTAIDAAVDNAHACIQVLGGIGFTWEHDAHLYLRRALALRALVGSADTAAVGLARRAAQGTRRAVRVDLDGRDAAIRASVRAEVAGIAALDPEQRRVALVDSGYLMPHWPAPHGLGADAVTQLVIDEELARAEVERPDIVIAGWALPTILEHGTPEQQERFVRPSLLGELVWCQLFSEPGAGSDLASLRTRAIKVEGGWRITGQKVWTSVARSADWGICLARTDPDAPRHRGITYFLVDMRNSEGIEIRPLREMTGDALFNEVFLDDVFVPDSLVVGEVHDGWRLARTTLANERVAMATSRLGKSVERAVDLLDGTSPAFDQAAVGRAVALATICSLLGVRTVLRSLGGHGPGAESSVAKLLGVRSRQDSADLVLRLHGPAAALGGSAGEAGEAGEAVRADAWEALNTRCLSIAGGTTQILRNVAAERILGLPRG